MGKTVYVMRKLNALR